MAKLEPLTKEEQVIYRSLSKDPATYPMPIPGMHECVTCGAKFYEIPATKERQAISALEQFSDHVAKHNPSPAQWTEAYRRMQKAKEQAKRQNADTDM